MQRLLVLAAGLVLLALTTLSADAAPPVTWGIVTLDTPNLHYGDSATFSYTVPRRHREMMFGVLCWQRPIVTLLDYSLILERRLDSHAYSGTVTVQIANGQGGINWSLIPLDYTPPADCVAYVFREPKSANASGLILTNIVDFRVQPRTGGQSGTNN